MKRTILRVFVMVAAIMAIVTVHAANMAADIVDKAVSKYQSAPSLTVKFSVEASGEIASGQLVASGDRFTIDMGGMQTWYDGRTQWSYLKSVNEVNITEPTVDELAQINPFAIVANLRGAFAASLVSSGTKGNVVRFVPKSGTLTDISSITVTFDRDTSWPRSIDIAAASGRMLITVTSVTVGSKLPVSSFVYNKKLHPKAEIVDLR